MLDQVARLEILAQQVTAEQAELLEREDVLEAHKE